EYDQIATAAGASLQAAPRTTVLIWAPLKDLETFDRLVRSLEALRPACGVVAEVRLRPPLNPMRLNGCAVVALNPPAGLAEEAQAACVWTARALGEPGGLGRVWPLQPQA
ncbi:MAG: 23S rRNA (adenine(2030)-N(6))-methyltransferase RlmJ, partial [Pseudomonadota bacterium]|nr:23S rRNA (adenine(2030)-N(6))-methyltransferase RlmJ [Pseudomonadota bacterium]